MQDQDMNSATVVNMSQLKRQMSLWRQNLPSVQPFYAVKCNPSQIIVNTLQKLGAYFDCASPAEIKIAIAAGNKPENVIFANPQKPESMIKEAYQLGVNWFTFDCEDELRKMLRLLPDFGKLKLTLRVLPPDDGVSSSCSFGVKFGATEKECKRLIKIISKLEDEVELCGFSFHVGSGCTSHVPYEKAIELCGRLSIFAKDQGLKPYLLDLGGGFITPKCQQHFADFASQKISDFPAICQRINESLSLVQGKFGDGFKVIAEPGRFFAADCVSTVMKIHGRRVLFEEADNENDYLGFESEAEMLESGHFQVDQVKYYTTDGCYGMFNNIYFDHVDPVVSFYRQAEKVVSNLHYQSDMFGPTCDSMDCVFKQKKLPLLEVGDCVVAECFGAYTLAAVTEFNGIKVADAFAVLEAGDNI